MLCIVVCLSKVYLHIILYIYYKIIKCGIYTMKYYSAVRNDEDMSFAGKEMELEFILSIKIRQARKISTVLHVFPNM